MLCFYLNQEKVSFIALVSKSCGIHTGQLKHLAFTAESDFQTACCKEPENVIYGENKRKVVSMVLFRPTKAVVFQIFKR
jgi:hypothetical protein